MTSPETSLTLVTAPTMVNLCLGKSIHHKLEYRSVEPKDSALDKQFLSAISGRKCR
jgi:hypothetical protein